jgi:hypothetical protein
MPQSEFFSDEEAQRVLHLAAQITPTTGMSRDELVRAASEMGIPPERIAEAEAQILAERESRIQEQNDRALRSEFQRYYRNKILGQIWSFAGANVFWIFIWAVCGMGYFWPIWIFGWWGVALLGSVFNSAFNPNHREQAYQKWLARKTGQPSLAADIEDEEEESSHDWRHHRRRERRMRRRDW